MDNIQNKKEKEDKILLNTITVWDYYSLTKDLLLNKIQINNKWEITFINEDYIKSLNEGEKLLITRWTTYFVSWEEYFLYQNLFLFFIPLLNKEPEDEIFIWDSIEDKILIRYNIFNLYNKYYSNLILFDQRSWNKMMLKLLQLLKICNNDAFLNNIYKNLPNLLLVRNELSELIAIPFTLETYTKFINYVKENLIYKENPKLYLDNLVELWKQLDKANKKIFWWKKWLNAEEINKDKKDIEFILEDIDKEVIVDNKVKLLKKFLDNKDSIIENMKKEVIWQNNIIDEIFPSIWKVVMWLNERPASFLFLGESWVWKTRLWKVIAKTLWTEACIISLSNYHSEHTMAAIVWAPHWYAGFAQETLIEKYINWLEVNYQDWAIPVIIFDEIEKADESIQNIWLELLDLWTITLMNWKIIDLKWSIIVLTSNLWIQRQAKIWFDINNETKEEEQKTKENEINNSVNKFLKKEILNRIEKSLIFNSLYEDDFKKIKIKIKQDILEKQISSNELLGRYLRLSNKNKSDLIDYVIKNSKDIDIDNDNNEANIRKFEKELENCFYNLIIEFLYGKK